MIASPASALAHFAADGLPRPHGPERLTADIALTGLACAALDVPFDLSTFAPPLGPDGVGAAVDGAGQVIRQGSAAEATRAALWLGLLPTPQRSALVQFAADHTEHGPITVDGTALLLETAIAGLVLLFDSKVHPERFPEAARAAQHLVRHFRPLSGGLWATHVREREAALEPDAFTYAVTGLLLTALNTDPHPDELLACCEQCATTSLLHGDGYAGPTGRVCPRATSMVAALRAAAFNPGLAWTLHSYKRIDPTSRVVIGEGGEDLVATLLFHAAITGRLLVAS